MLEFIQNHIGILESLYKEFTAFTKINPVVGGMVGLWAMGIVTFLIKDVPRKIGYLLDRYLTVTLTLSNDGISYYHFLQWYQDNKEVKNNRTIRVTNGRYGHDDPEIALGYGNHWIIHNKWIFKVSRDKDDASATDKTKETISIKTVGLNQKNLIKLVKSTFPKKREKRRYVYTYDAHNGWCSKEQVPNRTMDSVILKEGQKERILKFLDDFDNEKEWYDSMGVSYKTGIILSGPPGTGKTSLVKAIAKYYNKHLCVIGCSSLTDVKFLDALTDLPSDSIVLMEDFDSISATKSREIIDNEGERYVPLTLSGMLNAIDGVFSNEGRILIATTNHIENLDSALLRPGRFDLNEVIDHADSDMITRMFNKFYPDYNKELDIEVYNNVSLAKVENVFLETKNNPEEALTKLKATLTDGNSFEYTK